MSIFTTYAASGEVIGGGLVSVRDFSCGLEETNDTTRCGDLRNR